MRNLLFPVSLVEFCSNACSQKKIFPDTYRKMSEKFLEMNTTTRNIAPSHVHVSPSNDRISPMSLSSTSSTGVTGVSVGEATPGEGNTTKSSKVVNIPQNSKTPNTSFGFTKDSHQNTHTV